MNYQIIPHLYMILSVFLYNSMDLVLKLANEPFLIEVLFLNCTSALGFTFVIMQYKNKTYKLTTNHYLLHIFRSLSGMLFILCLCWSLRNLSLSTVNIVNSIVPLVVIIMSKFFLKESFCISHLILLLVSFLGTVLTIAPYFNSFTLIEIFIPVIGVVFFSLMRVLTKFLSSKENIFQICLLFYITTAFISFLFIKIENLIQIKEESYYLIFTSGIIGVYAQILMNKALQYSNLSNLIIYEYTGILWACLFDYIIWSTIPHQLTITGCFIIVISSVLLLKINNLCFRSS